MNKLSQQENLFSNFDEKVINFIEMLNNKKNIGKVPEPTKLRISTRSATCSLSCQVDLIKLCKIVTKNIVNNILLKKNEKFLIKGICMKNLVLVSMKKHKKFKMSNINVENYEEILSKLDNGVREHFYNQCTIIVKPDETRRPVNIKLFSNGSVSMTGCLYNEDGYDAVGVLIDELKKTPEVFFNDIDNINIMGYKITMINSDYKLNFKVNRINLFNKLLDTGLFVMYDPETYPGVKIYYSWNLFNNENNGICKCKGKCNGKGNGSGEGQCKKVTVAIFQSGSVIITGARSEIQINHVYDKINKIIKENYTDIIKYSILDCLEESDDKPLDESYMNKNDFVKIRVKKRKKKLKN